MSNYLFFRDWNETLRMTVGFTIWLPQYNPITAIKNKVISRCSCLFSHIFKPCYFIFTNECVGMHRKILGTKYASMSSSHVQTQSYQHSIVWRGNHNRPCLMFFRHLVSVNGHANERKIIRGAIFAHRIKSLVEIEHSRIKLNLHRECLRILIYDPKTQVIW